MTQSNAIKGIFFFETCIASNQILNGNEGLKYLKTWPPVPLNSTLFWNCWILSREYKSPNGICIHIKSATLYCLQISSELQLALIWDWLKGFNSFWLKSLGDQFDPKNRSGGLPLLFTFGIIHFLNSMMYSLDLVTRAIDNRRRVWAVRREGGSQRCDLERRTDT